MEFAAEAYWPPPLNDLCGTADRPDWPLPVQSPGCRRTRGGATVSPLSASVPACHVCQENHAATARTAPVTAILAGRLAGAVVEACDAVPLAQVNNPSAHARRGQLSGSGLEGSAGGPEETANFTPRRNGLVQLGSDLNGLVGSPSIRDEPGWCPCRLRDGVRRGGGVACR